MPARHHATPSLPSPIPFTSARKLLALAIFGGASLTGAETFAATLQLESENVINVDEPNSGSRSLAVKLRASFNDGNPTWNTQATCTISGEVEIVQPNAPSRPQATAGVDFVQQTRTFSIQTQPFVGETGIPDATTDIIFDILDDGDEEEVTEDFRFEITSYGVSCSDEATRTISLTRGYGTVVINDPFDVKDTSGGAPRSPIPIRQKSLTSQLNGLRTLSIHNSITRDRSIAKEIDRARKSRGFSSDHLQVNVQGQATPGGALMGGAAGDADFGRWGFFISGNLDIGEQERHSSNEADYHSNMLIAGVDYKISDNIVLGSALTRSDVVAGDDLTANTDFSRYSASLFGSIYSGDAFYVDAMLTYGSSKYDLDRKILVDNSNSDTGYANTDGDELSGSLGAGYSFHLQNLKARLFSFLNYVDADIDGYRESVNGYSSAAVIDGVALQSFIADLGLEVSWNINTNAGIFIPTFSLAQERQYADDSVYITGRFLGGQDAGDFAYTAPERDDDYLNAQAGFSAVLKNGVSAYLTYDTFIDRKDFASSQWSVGARWEF